MANILQIGKLYQYKRFENSHGEWPKNHLIRHVEDNSNKSVADVLWDMKNEVYLLPMLYLGSEPFQERGWTLFPRHNPIFLIGDGKYKSFAIDIQKSDEYFKIVGENK